MKNFKRSYAVACGGDRPSPARLVQQGLALHGEGRLDDAFAQYERALALAPDTVDALHLSGLALIALGKPDAAAVRIERATRLAPNAVGFASLGNARLAMGDILGAVEAYEESVRQDPQDADGHYNLANARLRAGALDEALDGYAEALRLKPESLSARFNRANALASAGRHLEAIDDYREIATTNPGFPFLWTNMGVSLVSLDCLEGAVEAFSAALRFQPDNAQAHNNLGCVLGRLERFKDALPYLQRAVALAPDDIDARLNLARSLQRAHLTESVDVAREATRLAPNYAPAWRTLGDALHAFGDSLPALEAYDRARSLDPECLAADINNCGLALLAESRFEEAIAFYEALLPYHPNDSWAWGESCLMRMHQGDVPSAIEALRHSLALRPSDEYVHSNLILNLCYSEDHSGEDLREEAEAWAAVHVPKGLELPPVHGGTGDRLRIGYLSADFHVHPAGHLYEAMFPHHDRSRFEIVAYANQIARDEVTDRIAASVDRWNVVKAEDDDALVDRIRRDGIDILVDLLGHTPNHRLKAFGRKPAPVQATWLGFFGTTGMSQMDFILADRYLIPERHEGHFTERPARMPGCLYVFQPPKLDLDVSPLPALENGYITFGCFNNTAKITPDTVALWCDVLRAMPESRMVLNRWPFESARVRNRFAALFAANGVDPSRVEFRATKGREAYFRSYYDVDLMLDTLPYGAGTTTSEALWMGVPVVSLSSERFVGRMTESILHAVGVPELLPEDRADFARLALDLANDIPRLRDLRATLRARTVESPLCDLPRYTRDLESTFEWMWANRSR